MLAPREALPERATGTPAPAEQAWTGRLRDASRRLADQARTALHAISPAGPHKNAVWLASFTALGAAELTYLAPRTTPLLRGLQVAGLGGAAGLVIVGAHDLRKARDTPTRLDAASDLVWGLQGLTALSLPASGSIETLALGMGLAGAAIQTTVGVLRIQRGVRDRDHAMVKLGALDVGGGLLWLGWDLLGWQSPLYVGSYVVLMIGREAYANREAVRRLGGNARQLARRAWSALSRDAQELVQGSVDDAQALLALARRPAR